METVSYNINGKIWIFVEVGIQVEILKDTDQLLSFKLTQLDGGQDFVMTVIYASTDRDTRKALCEDLYDIATHINLPWLVGGDFNVITEAAEKYGGLPVQFAETEDFRHCINSCQLADLGFTGSMFTWWNGRSDEACIFKRLDRCLGNQALQNIYPNLEVDHLIKQAQIPSITSIPLSIWSKETYGDIFKQIATLEEVVQIHDQEFEQHPSSLNRKKLQKVQADLIRFYAVEEKFWKHKVGMQWFKDGNRNTKFFHAHVNGKRRRLQLKRIQDSGGVWLEAEDDIAGEAIRFFTNQFSEENILDALRCLSTYPK
ncbi:uncharacterized protein LOC132628554 [Lycium barbarum]|uniref:uncharacterized protein LOC132628554 n=1 Tax=Lycium barbarum TaxID=112863 RepID=UPI00293F0747|nr:uncharacterized protein LOC132628554 [Lycium barbarum]